MPVSPRKTVLCRYHYDPLDRLADCALSAQADIQRFYCKSRLATEVQGAVHCSIFQHDDQLLAQLQRQDAKVDTTLLATDQQRSILNALDAAQHPLAYTPYGHRPLGNGLLSMLGFNGERPDPVTGHYLLGNGYRAFNPVLMRFNSPDSWSPFGKGGMNTYGYCGGDPMNRLDETGHAWRGISKFFGRMFGKVPKKEPKTTSSVSTTVAGSDNASKATPASPPPFSSPKTTDNLTPDDFFYDDLDLELFAPKRPIVNSQRIGLISKQAFKNAPTLNSKGGPKISPQATIPVSRPIVSAPLTQQQRANIEIRLQKSEKALRRLPTGKLAYDYMDEITSLETRIDRDRGKLGMPDRD